ncbi:MAG: hypothetical protein DRO09_00575 [Thermoprotei archaeon]|nr:MAG: hypothetical protein DRO09_00575 [Thermoprotei archaeon]
MVFYGKGKGKTTAAVGTAMRALGRGWRVLIVHFLKPAKSGEQLLFKELSKHSAFKHRLMWLTLGTEEFVSVNDLGGSAASINMALSYGFLKYLYQDIVKSFNPRLVVFDELGIATHLGIVDEILASNVLERFSGSLERHAIVTGRYVPKPIRDIADLVTKINEVKHYFKAGIASIEGLDY